MNEQLGDQNAHVHRLAVLRNRQDARERELRRDMLREDHDRITELLSWLRGRPEDEIGNAVGRELGLIASDYLDACAELEVEP